jgi:hypothetical protein
MNPFSLLAKDVVRRQHSGSALDDDAGRVDFRVGLTQGSNGASPSFFRRAEVNEENLVEFVMNDIG